ncbi:MAG: S8 family serine peptidase [Pseudomonadota bacterium]
MISEHDLGSLDATVIRLSVPVGLTSQGAVDLAQSLVPGALFDVHDLFSGSGIGCSDCWGAELVQFERLPRDACRRGAPIAILDTEVDVDHPALEGASIAARSFLQSGQSEVRDGHGTAVAALLVGESAPQALPLAPANHLLAASVFRRVGDETRADTVAIMRALDWALSNRARVIAMSFEGAGNRALHQAIRLAAGQASLVGAAGNGGRSADPAYPAAFPEVIAVTALDDRRRAFRSGNRGAYVEIAAPGVEVVSAAPDGGWQEWTGTSFAVPFVAAALLRARAETRGDAAAARALLAQKAADLGAQGRDEVYGYGLLQIRTGRCW